MDVVFKALHSPMAVDPLWVSCAGEFCSPSWFGDCQQRDSG